MARLVYNYAGLTITLLYIVILNLYLHLVVCMFGWQRIEGKLPITEKKLNFICYY